MHLYTKHELYKGHLTALQPLQKLEGEKTVILNKKGGTAKRLGKFDFYAELANGKKIGIEVLTRPTHGKIREKLAYAENVDQFIFVLPHEAMDIYRKRKSKPFKPVAKQKAFSKELNDPKLHVWLFDVANERFAEKGRFDKVFNVSARQRR